MLPFRIGLCLFCLASRSTGQSESADSLKSITYNRYELSIDGGYGVFLAHRNIMRQLVTGHPYQFSIKAGKRSENDIFHYPVQGIKASFYQNYSKERIGFALALMPYIDFPLSSGNEKWILGVSCGIGIIQKPFNQQKNHKNIAVGSLLNGAVNFDMRRNFSHRLGNCYVGLNLVHFSNSAFQSPNLGLNFLTINAGFTLQKGEKKIYPDLLMVATRNFFIHRWTIMGIGSIKSIEMVYKTKVGIWGINTEYLHWLNTKSSLLAGGDLVYNNALRQTMSNYEKDLDILQFGVYGGYQLNVYRLKMLTTMGVYIRNKAEELGLFYHRLAFRYHFNRNFALQMGIRSHFAVADFLETGLIYRIK
ncbi:MAG: acyloxyacyl hydrolase [Flavobacteriales bacterium]